jgi:hypothetical protein
LEAEVAVPLLLLFLTSTVAIALLFCIYRRALYLYAPPRRRLRKRVAYMVWAAAQHVK